MLKCSIWLNLVLNSVNLNLVDLALLDIFYLKNMKKIELILNS
jgi:hypothetical protein